MFRKVLVIASQTGQQCAGRRITGFTELTSVGRQFKLYLWAWFLY